MNDKKQELKFSFIIILKNYSKVNLHPHITRFSSTTHSDKWTHKLLQRISHLLLTQDLCRSHLLKV